MKTLNKAVIAASVAAALTPVASQADTTIFGQIDIAVAVESAEETALVVSASPVAGDNVLGIEGEIETNSGNAITYQYVINLDVDGDGGDADVAFGTNYHSYLGYKWDSVEVRAGNQDTPLRLTLDKADLFAGTYADQNNVVRINTTATDSFMVLGGNDTIKYAVSADAAAGEDSNNPDQSDDIRFGAMADFTASDTTSFAIGLESLTDVYDAFGASANIGIGDTADLTLALNSLNIDDTDTDVTDFVIGVKFGVSEDTDIKVQYAQSDIDGLDVTPSYFALGADFHVADNAKFYLLAASGSEGGLLSNGFTLDNNGDVDTVEVDNGGDSSVIAAGWRVNF